VAWSLFFGRNLPATIFEAVDARLSPGSVLVVATVVAAVADLSIVVFKVTPVGDSVWIEVKGDLLLVEVK